MVQFGFGFGVWICALPNTNDLHNQLNLNSRINANNCESAVTLIHFPSFPLFDISMSGATLFFSNFICPLNCRAAHQSKPYPCRSKMSRANSEPKKKMFNKTVFPKTIIMIRLEWHGEYFELLCVPFGLPSSVKLSRVELRFCFIGPFVHCTLP